MTAIPTPKIVSAPKKKPTLTLDASTMTRLQVRAKELSDSLGFDVSLSDTVAFLLKALEEKKEQKKEQKKELRDDSTLFPTPGTPGNTRTMTPREIQECARIASGTAPAKINAIKYVRERTGVGLKEAKDFVEANFTFPLPVQLTNGTT